MISPWDIVSNIGLNWIPKLIKGEKEEAILFYFVTN